MPLGQTFGHAAVVEHRRSLTHDPAEIAAGAVETAVDQRFELGLQARALRLRQIAVLQLGQQRDGLGDPGQRALRLTARETRRRIGHQPADRAREPGVELAREHLVGLQVERAVAPKSLSGTALPSEDQNCLS